MHVCFIVSNRTKQTSNEHIHRIDACHSTRSWYYICWHLIFIVFYFILFLFSLYILALFAWVGLIESGLVSVCMFRLILFWRNGNFAVAEWMLVWCNRCWCFLDVYRAFLLKLSHYTVIVLCQQHNRMNAILIVRKIKKRRKRRERELRAPQ